MGARNLDLANRIANPTSRYGPVLDDLRQLLGFEKTQGPGDVAGGLDTPHPTTYRFSAQAQDLVPACRALPTTAGDVSVILKYCKEKKVPFAVKSGGHGLYATASSSDGVVIDFSLLNTVEIASDKKYVLVGSGARWGKVYKTLEKVGLSCGGGRFTGVGVGGLLLGGGISFFSGQRGLGSDHVRSYTVVLASGDIVKVTRDSHRDLFWALRGAGPNMCIVVQFELETFEQGKLWGGLKVVPSTSDSALLPAFANICKNASDPHAAMSISTTYTAKHDSYISAIVFTHSKAEVEPAVWKPFKAIPGIFSSLRIATLVELTDELEATNPSGLRFKGKTFSIKSDGALLKQVESIFKEEIEPIKTLTNLKPAILMQPLLPSMLPTDGIGNTLGIKREDGPLHIIALLVSWTESRDDERILKAIDNVITRSVAAAKSKDLFHPYIYLNYASGEQDVYGSYGVENQKKLLAISRKYDPEQVFEKLCPGYIHLRPTVRKRESIL